MIEGHTFVTAHFTNNERTFVTSIWQDKDGTLRPFNLVAEKGNQYWKELQQYITEDRLHENTFKHIKESKKAFEQELTAIAEAEGIDWISIRGTENSTIDAITDWVYTTYDNEQVFKIKLRLFEHDKVKKSTDTEKKSALRKARTVPELLKAYLEF
tara:strand:+ start:556 stop:1023 length:468 start_codon:yes stop_codon:yes gene_type:complete